MPPRSPTTAFLAVLASLSLIAPSIRAEPSLERAGAGLSLRAHQLNHAMVAARQAVRRGETPPRLAPLPPGAFAGGASIEGRIADGTPFDYAQWNAVVGGDRRFAPNFLAGLAVGIGQAGADIGVRDRVVRDGVSVTPFATYSAQHWYVDTVGSLSRDMFRLDRDGERAGQATGWTASGAIEAGLKLTFGALSLGPFTGLRWARSVVGVLDDRTGPARTGRSSAGERTGTAGLQIRADLRRAEAAIVPRIRFAMEQPLDGTAVNSRSIPRDERPYAIASDTAAGRVYRARAELHVRARSPGALVLASEAALFTGEAEKTTFTIGARFRF
jgi:hypothetical protein